MRRHAESLNSGNSGVLCILNGIAVLCQIVLNG